MRRPCYRKIHNGPRTGSVKRTEDIQTGREREISGLDVVIFLEHLLQLAVFELVRLGDQVEVSDIRLVGRMQQGIAQKWSDPAVHPVARSDAIQCEPYLRSAR